MNTAMVNNLNVHLVFTPHWPYRLPSSWKIKHDSAQELKFASAEQRTERVQPPLANSSDTKPRTQSVQTWPKKETKTPLMHLVMTADRWLKSKPYLLMANVSGCKCVQQVLPLYFRQLLPQGIWCHVQSWWACCTGWACSSKRWQGRSTLCSHNACQFFLLRFL